MLGVLDADLFPDECEVVEIPLHNQFVYLIQKNGNSSLRTDATVNSYKIFRNEQIKNLNCVDVYIRNPRARYVSGVNTYLQHLQRDYPDLDYKTAFWFAKQYKCLNRHYLPQLHWIYNLSRFMNCEAKIQLHDFQTFGNITNTKTRAGVTPPTQEFVQQLLNNNKGIEFWWYVDQILLNLAGSQMTWQEIVSHYKEHYPDIAQHVLPKT